VLVESRQSFFPRNRRHLLSGLVLWKAPAIDVEIFSIVAGDRFHLAGQPAHPPDSFPVSDRVSRELKRLGNNYLFWTLFWLINDRGRIAGDNDWPVDLPTQAPVIFIYRDEIRRRAILID